MNKPVITSHTSATQRVFIGWKKNEKDVVKGLKGVYQPPEMGGAGINFRCLCVCVSALGPPISRQTSFRVPFSGSMFSFRECAIGFEQSGNNTAGCRTQRQGWKDSDTPAIKLSLPGPSK